MVLQPSDERRRSGSHYTPRSLTEPIVRTTLHPVLERLGANPTPEQILELNVCDPAMGSGAFLVETCRQLGDELVKAWHVHKQVPKLPPDEDELLHARRVIAQRCLYGVDRNPMAVDLAKLSLWLATLAKDHPFTFLDHSLRAGDSLIGLTKKQIAAFHWALPEGKPKKPQGGFSFGDPIAAAIKRATEYRQKILAARDEVPYEHLRQQLDKADEALDLARFVGDLVIAAYFSADKDKAREARLREYALRLVKYLGPGGKMEDRQPLAEPIRQLRSGDRPTPPFHWEIEFPEVFGQGNPGFDAIIGNPPFAGKNTLLNSNCEGYLDWLKQINEESHGNSDLVAHFFRRAFSLLREPGCFGLIATKTIRQGDTRLTGLYWIRTHGGRIYDATRRLRWPGQAAVMVSVVHVGKASHFSGCMLDGRPVSEITAFLFHAGGDDEPARLLANAGKSFIGHFISGTGFTFDDTDHSGLATSTAEMSRILRDHPKSKERVFPYIGGEEVLNDPCQRPHRYVINFEEMSESAARKWPALMAIVERNVRPERESLPPKNAWNRTIAERWWLFGAYRKELREATSELPRVLFHPNLSSHCVFAFLPSGIIVGAPHNVFAFDTYAPFCSLQSRLHDCWAWFFGSTFKDDLRYTPQRCFETFPFPRQGADELEEVGTEYYQFRAALLIDNKEGLTKTYNRFHDPNETSPEILKLRKLHAAMDRTVLDAYGWTDLKPTCEFLLDYEEEDEDENGGQSNKKKPWRYRWPDEFRDEVLARLLELNKKRAEEEQLAGLANEAGARAKHTDNSAGSPAAPATRRKRSRHRQEGKQLPGME
jgi:hypothetical protein